MFVGEWQRRYLLPASLPPLPLEEREVRRKRNWARGGHTWIGEQTNGNGFRHSPKSVSSEESFDFMHGAEAESSQLFSKNVEAEDDHDEGVGPQVHPWTSEHGHGVFTKM